MSTVGSPAEGRRSTGPDAPGPPRPPGPLDPSGPPGPLGPTVPPGLPDLEGYLRRWSALHGGVDASASPLLRTWLSLTYGLARPLARAGVGPDALTLGGLLVSAAVVPVAGAGGRWPLLAVPVTVLSGLVDNLDGAVAVLTDRTSRWGYVLDSVVDRGSDAAYVAAMWALGAPGELAVLAGAVAWLQEYARARAGAAGMSDVGVVTVAERPTRVIGTAMFALGAGLHPDTAATWGTVGAAAGAAIGAVGLVQLLADVRRRLR